MGTAITIGNFDGVHLGHVALLRAARQRAGNAGRVVVVTFDPHPAAILAPGKQPPRLMSLDDRRAALLAAGADEVVALQPTPEFLTTPAEAFIDGLVDRFAPGWFVEGDDFHYGQGRKGTIQTLRAHGLRRGFELHVVESVVTPLLDHTIAPVSSSLVRWLVSHGRVGDAAALLGRPYELVGVVERGDQIGRTIGVRTANLHQDSDEACLLPADGVYAGWAQLPDGRSLPAAINIGVRPTVAGTTRRVEAHLIDPDSAPDPRPASGVPDYGWRLRLGFQAWLREQVRFSSREALREQLRRDTARALRLLVPGVLPSITSLRVSPSPASQRTAT